MLEADVTGVELSDAPGGRPRPNSGPRSERCSRRPTTTTRASPTSAAAAERPAARGTAAYAPAVPRPARCAASALRRWLAAIDSLGGGDPRARLAEMDARIAANRRDFRGASAAPTVLMASPALDRGDGRAARILMRDQGLERRAARRPSSPSSRSSRPPKVKVARWPDPAGRPGGHHHRRRLSSVVLS